LIHNDYKYDNLVLDPQAPWKVRAVLDWEMATLGDPLADLGTALSYWIDATDPDDVQALNLGLTALPGNLTRAQIAERYAEKSGRGLTEQVFHYALGLFKVCGICQQLYFRYRKGFTQDERFALLLPGIETLARQASRAIAQGKVSGLGA
jgi:aminoglycoside phosphotransferase (APT) family kinase protein